MADIPLTGVEIFFPISTSISNDKLVFESDNRNFNVTQKNSVSARKEIATIDLKIRGTEFQTFYDFIKSNFKSVVQFNKAGVQPFINALTDQDVRIISYSEPVKSQNRHYTMTITIEKV